MHTTFVAGGKPVRRAAGLIVGVWASVAWAQQPAPASVDRIEAIQPRAWIRNGAVTLAPTFASAVDDPFLLRGGAGARVAWWPRSMLAFSLEASAWGQTRTAAARVAQRELRARLRPTGSGWFSALSVEVVGVDGKIAGFGGILPFELGLRAGVGAASSRDDFASSPALAFTGAAVARWFYAPIFGVETSLVVRSAALERTVDGRRFSASDTVVSFELGFPFFVGGRP